MIPILITGFITGGQQRYRLIDQFDGALEHSGRKSYQYILNILVQNGKKTMKFPNVVIDKISNH